MELLQVLPFGAFIEEGGLRVAFLFAQNSIADLRRRVMIVVMAFRMDMGQMLVGPAHPVDQFKNVNGFEAVLFHGVAHLHAARQEGDARDV